MIQVVQILAQTDSSSSGIGALGINFSAFIIQLISFIFVFLILKRFAFKPIIKLLTERRKTIDEGVKMGQALAEERAKLEAEVAQTMREARQEADKIIATSHKEAREVIREAEKIAQRKADSMLSDAEARINEESIQARRRLEKDIVALVSDATEAIVGEKVDVKKDAELIEKIIKERVK